MKKQNTLGYLVAAMIVALLGYLIKAQNSPGAFRPNSAAVYYSREHKLNEEIISRIQEADQFVYFSVYTFTKQDIKDALLGAKHRGLIVEGVVDEGQTKQISQQKNLVSELVAAGIPVTEARPGGGIMHTKFLITDKAYASGSYNWTSAATSDNDEVLETGNDPGLVAMYKEIFLKILARYSGP